MKVFAFLLFTFTTLYAGVALRLETTNLSTNKFNVEASMTSNTFSTFLNLSISNDKNYYDPIHSRFYFGYHFDGFGGMVLKVGDISIRAGKMLQRDEVNSPYSLFLSSEKNPYVSMSLNYESDWLFFKTVWMELTKSVNVMDSIHPYSFPDRGMNYRSFGMRYRGFKLGYQESVVYTERTFDFEYFFDPLPNFFTQYINFVGRPFRQGTNDNSMVGFFASYSSDLVYTYIQLLIDDMNMNRFYGGFQNPDKLGWSLGVRFSTPMGEFFAYHAGTTEYTFEPSTSSVEDQYYHYPEVVAPVGNSTRTVSIEENCVGYKYGENTLSFLLGWKKKVLGLETDMWLELVLSGSKSPIKPWHGYGKIPQGTHLLDESPVERAFRAVGSVKKRFGNLSAEFKLEFSRVENPLRLVDGVYKPSEGVKNSGNLAIEISYSF